MTSQKMVRHDGRSPDDLRDIEIQRPYLGSAPGSLLYRSGQTTVLCTASVDESVPHWMQGQGRGWITAEYSMLPGSTSPRKRRDRAGKVDGRTTEIQRLIGRSLRAIADLDALGERTITVDCDVLQADGGTRTASITGAMIALVDALNSVDVPWEKFPLRDTVAAVSVGLVELKQGQSPEAVLDLDYHEDHRAAVDMNVVMTGGGRFVEIQGTGEEATFDDNDLGRLLALAKNGIGDLIEIQKKTLADAFGLLGGK